MLTTLQYNIMMYTVQINQVSLYVCPWYMLKFVILGLYGETAGYRNVVLESEMLLLHQVVF